MEEPNGPLLNLTMEKGPLSGQTLEFKPGSNIHIGRVIRGNTITIKDPGISSKHLCINFDSGSWVVTDLGSSNGTFLNTVLIDPTRPSKISDGDVVKIGELTSIKVKIVEMEGELGEGGEVKGKNTRRNPRRKAGGGCENGGNEHNVGVGVSKRVTRSKKNEGVVSVDKGENFDEVEVEKEMKANRGRTTRGAKKVESVKNGDDGVGEAENVDAVDVEREVKPITRRTRGAKKVESVKNGDDGAEEAENVDVEKERKPSPRRTRGAKRVESVKNGDDCVEKAENIDERKPSPRRTRGCRKAENLKTGVGSEDVEKENKVCTRRTRGSRKEEDVETLDENVGECIELKQRGKGKKSIERRVCSEEDGAMEHLEKDDCEEAVENNADKGVERYMLEEVALKSGREGCEASTSNAGINMGGVQMEEEVDLEKMTLGEWLDYLEVALPKQIIDATEEMILAMNQKAERFQEFMKQQKDLKGCDGIPKG